MLNDYFPGNGVSPPFLKHVLHEVRPHFAQRLVYSDSIEVLKQLQQLWQIQCSP